MTDSRNRELLFEANEEFIIKVQALARGYLARKKFSERKEYLNGQEPSVVKLQVRLIIIIIIINNMCLVARKPVLVVCEQHCFSRFGKYHI